MIADRTNPWVEVDGKPIDWRTHPARSGTINPDCGICGDALLGVIAPMDTAEGVQRCDECGIFDGDLEAAQALANLVGGVVRYTEEEDD